MEEKVACNPIDTHTTGKADGIFLGIGYLTIVDADVAKNIALAVMDSTIRVDIADAVSLGVKDIQLLDDSKCRAIVAAHSAVGVKRAHRAASLVAHHPIAVDASDAVEIGITNHLSAELG